MDIQTTMRRVLLGALVLTLGEIVASADIYSAPLRGGERCSRCERVVENPAVAGEILSKEKSVASPFRTIGCLLTYLRDKDIPADRIFVADHVTGRSMTFDADRIVALVLRVQGDFLETPALRLTLPDAERRFGADRHTCEAVLGTLVNSGVLARSDDGGYVDNLRLPQNATALEGLPQVRIEVTRDRASRRDRDAAEAGKSQLAIRIGWAA